MMVEVGRTMLTQIQKTLRASPTAIIVEVAIPDACVASVWILSGKTQNMYCSGFTSWAIAFGGVATGSMKA